MCTFAYVVIAHYIRSAAAVGGAVAAWWRRRQRLSLLLNIVLQPLPACSENSSILLFFFFFSSFVSVRFKSESLLSQLYVNAIRPRLSHLRQGVSLHNINQIQQRCNGWDSLFFKINDAEGKTCLVSIGS